MSRLAKLLKKLDGEICVVMESTRNYHAPVARLPHDDGLHISAVNAILVHSYGNNNLRRVKTDKKDSVKLANSGLHHCPHVAKICSSGGYPVAFEKLLSAVPR